MNRLSLICALCALSACATLPALDGTIDTDLRGAAFPELAPLPPLLARADAAGTGSGGTARITPQSIAAFDNRLARLRARAAVLRGPVLDSATRARLRPGPARAALQ